MDFNSVYTEKKANAPRPSKEKVRDAYLGDLPEALRAKVMAIHKLIKDTVNGLIEEDNYQDLRSSSWAMSCIDEFCAQPKDKADIGSVRVYKNGKNHRCMIQATGHFRNHQYGWIEELLHDFIGNVYTTVRPKLRKKFDLTITNEGRTGNPFEGFDLFTSPKQAKELWEMFDDRKIKTITENYHELSPYDPMTMMIVETTSTSNTITVGLKRLPTGLAALVNDTNEAIKSLMKTQSDDISKEHPKELQKAIYHIIGRGHIAEIGKTTITRLPSGAYTGEVQVTPPMDDKCAEAIKPIEADIQKLLKCIEKKLAPGFKKDNPGKKLVLTGQEGRKYFIITLDREYASKLYTQVGKRRKASQLVESTTSNDNITVTDVYIEMVDLGPTIKNLQDAIKDFDKAVVVDPDDGDFDLKIEVESDKMSATDTEELDKAVREWAKEQKAKVHLTNESDGYYYDISLNKKNYTEAAENTPEYNVKMSTTQAKRTIDTLSQQLINDFNANKSKKMTQYTANIYANLITKNLLPQWAPSFRKFSITLDDYQSFHTVEFKIPKMTLDFISRFINGRESLEGFLHRQPEIKMKISPRVFHTMKNPSDAFNFFKAAITYYDKKVGRAGERLMAEVMKLDHSMKHLIGTTKLSGIVTLPMTLLFVFDDVDMSSKDVFTLSDEDVRTVAQFVKNIDVHYAAPEKEKKAIIDDVQKMVKTLREATTMDDNIQELSYLPEAVKRLVEGGFSSEISDHNEKWYDEQVDYKAMRENKDPNVKLIMEKFGVKKLKKIPADLVAYIQIETESIKDANDKMMISSYCLSKIEIVEWYIELLDVGSKKYIVPHTKPYLETVRTQLLACFKKIMATPIPKADRPLIDIQYPKGYEG